MTPREVWAAVKAYRRRRGWMAWHVGMLGQIDPKEFPSLGKMTGEVPADRKGKTPDEMLAAARTLKTMLQRKAD